MTFQERISVAEEYLALTNQLISVGEFAAAGEMLWGAVHNVIQAIGVEHELLGDKEEVRRAVVINHLVVVHGYSDSLIDELQAAGRLHGHFYNRNVAEPRLLRELIPATQQYIGSLLSIAGTR